MGDTPNPAERSEALAALNQLLSKRDTGDWIELQPIHVVPGDHAVFEATYRSLNGNYPMTVELTDILGVASSVAASHGEASL